MRDFDKRELADDEMNNVVGGAEAMGPLLAVLGPALGAGLAAFLKALMSPAVAIGALFVRR